MEKEKRKGRIPSKHNVIVLYLKQNNMSSRDLAGHLGITTMQLYRCINEPHLMRLDRLRMIASYLDLSIYHLLFLLERNKSTLNKQDEILLSEKLGFIKNYYK